MLLFVVVLLLLLLLLSSSVRSTTSLLVNNSLGWSFTLAFGGASQQSSSSSSSTMTVVDVEDADDGDVLLDGRCLLFRELFGVVLQEIDVGVVESSGADDDTGDDVDVADVEVDGEGVVNVDVVVVVVTVGAVVVDSPSFPTGACMVETLDSDAGIWCRYTAYPRAST